MYEKIESNLKKKEEHKRKMIELHGKKIRTKKVDEAEQFFPAWPQDLTQEPKPDDPPVGKYRIYYFEKHKEYDEFMEKKREEMRLKKEQ